MLENQMTFRELAPAFLSFIGNAELFTINSRFDQRFLDNQLLESGFRALAAGRFVDMLPYLPSEHRGRGSQGIVEYAASDQQEKRGLTIEVMEGIYRKLFRPGI
jgi:DNA polymerase III epsilon subunit-like protein